MDFVDQLRSTVDIVDVVGQFVRLKKSGAGPRWAGLCPFHNEKTPSFSVHGTHQFYKCFGCGAGGDVFKFVMEIERLSFYEALEWLANRYGIPMPKRQEYADEDTKLRAALYRMHEIAQEQFRANLRSEAGAAGRGYLERRGLTAQQIEEFGLGFAAASWDALTGRLRREGFTEAQLEASGLASRRQEGGGFYDRFRNRLIFPIHNDSGKIIAFAGRALSAEDQPKYINSPETPIYRKSFVLYNLHRAKEAMRKNGRVVLVEGYMDVIGVYSAGASEVVASCGTSLTAQQVKILKRYAEQIVVNFDPDGAGANAAERSIQILLEEDLRVRVLGLDGGLDPDEYVKQRGAEAYQSKLAAAQGYFYWLADRARQKFDMRTGEGRVAALKMLLPPLHRVSNRIERMTLAADVAAYLGVEAGLVIEEFKKAALNRREADLKGEAPKISRVERVLLHWLLEDPDTRAELVPRLAEAPWLDRLGLGRILRLILHLHATDPEFRYDRLEARLEDADRDLLSRLVLDDELGREHYAPERAEALFELLDRRHRQAQLAELRARVREADRAGNLEEALRLYEQIAVLERRQPAAP